MKVLCLYLGKSVMEMFEFKITSMEYAESMAEVYSQAFWELAIPLENMVIL